MKKILITTDLSDDSKAAFDTGLALSKAFGSELLLAAVVEDPSHAAMLAPLDLPVYPDPDVQSRVLEKVEADLCALKAKHFADSTCSTFALRSTHPIHREIIEFARAQGADLIVMATHGRTGMAHMLIGSVAEKVVRESHCPVLTVPIKDRG